MEIPDKHRELLQFLAAQHWRDQLAQVRMLGHSHPQAPRARAHLDEARELARDVGVDVDKAA